MMLIIGENQCKVINNIMFCFVAFFLSILEHEFWSPLCQAGVVCDRFGCYDMELNREYASGFYYYMLISTYNIILQKFIDM